MEVSQGPAVSTLSTELTVTKDSGQRLMVHLPSESEGPRESHVPLGVGERRLCELSSETTTGAEKQMSSTLEFPEETGIQAAPIAPI